jgi:hypothetical protein
MNEITFECEFCKHKLKSISSLNYHLKTAKYCLVLRNKTSDNFKCEYCLKEFTTKNKCNIHVIKCKTVFKNFNDYKNENTILKDKIIDKDGQIMELKLQIQELQNKLENIASNYYK